MADEWLIGMAIDLANQSWYPAGTVDLKVDDDVGSGRGMESLGEVMMIDCDVGGLGSLAVHHGRHETGFAQPAGSATTDGATGIGFEVDLSHD
jgi:hypothetical protein